MFAIPLPFTIKFDCLYKGIQSYDYRDEAGPILQTRIQHSITSTSECSLVAPTFTYTALYPWPADNTMQNFMRGLTTILYFWFTSPCGASVRTASGGVAGPSSMVTTIQIPPTQCQGYFCLLQSIPISSPVYGPAVHPRRTELGRS